MPICHVCKRPIWFSQHRWELIPAGSDGWKPSVVAHAEPTSDCAQKLIDSGDWELL